MSQQPSQPPSLSSPLKRRAAAKAQANTEGAASSASSYRARRMRAGARTSSWSRIISVPLTYLSASMAVIFAVAMTVGYLATQWRDVVTVVVTLAVVVFANGWSDLVSAPDRMATRTTVTVSGVLAVIAVRLTGDFAAAAFVLGLVVLVAAVAEMARPTPREDLAASLSASTVGSLIAIAGVTWVGLSSSSPWLTISVASCVVVTCAVVGNQLGSSLRAHAVGALVCGAIGGLILGIIASMVVGQTAIIRMIFPSFTGVVAPIVAVIFLAMALGVMIAVVVALVDVLVGDHHRRHRESAAFARGAMKFLLVAVPIYVIVRIGAL